MEPEEEKSREIVEVAVPPVSKELKKRWSYLIRKVYETDPLTCPKCQGEMRIISFIDQPDVIKKILQHLGLWEESHAPPDKKQKKRSRLNLPIGSQFKNLLPQLRGRCPGLSRNRPQVDVTLPYRILPPKKAGTGPVWFL